VTESVSLSPSLLESSPTHRSMSLQGNLGEMTAKIGSQSTAASIAGTALGLTVSSLTGADFVSVLLAFLPISAVRCVNVEAWRDKGERESER
jgi:hypothetical protein